jgi:hypothetical protein
MEFVLVELIICAGEDANNGVMIVIINSGIEHSCVAIAFNSDTEDSENKNTVFEIYYKVCVFCGRVLYPGV